MKKIILDLLIIATIVATVMFVYKTYGEEIRSTMFGEQHPIVYINSVPLAVMVADEDAERKQGLSGVTSLGSNQGMLFVFDAEDYYGMWMKDMQIALDMLWVNNDMKIVHIEQNVTPDTFPTSFAPDEPARFVIETNAFFTQNQAIVEGDIVTLPPTLIPRDLINNLQ